MIDLAQVSEFMAANSRLLDRRRFELFTGEGTAEAALAALAAYRNLDGGYGSGLEPDLRSASSQPVTALHAFEVFEEIGPETTPETSRLCDWLGEITRPDGGLPFGLPFADTSGSAPFFAEVDPAESSLHMTSMLAGIAHRVARHDKAVREHEWLATATKYSLGRIRAMTELGHALEFRYSLMFLDALSDSLPEAETELRRLGGFLPESGMLSVSGGIDGEAMRPLDFAPVPDRPVRALFPAAAVEAELDQLVAAQSAEGGWDVDWGSFSAAGKFEWRGWATIRALRILRANGRS